MRRMLIALCLCCFAVPAYAWNGFGHMVVAERAWRDMTPAARARASELLRLNPMYSTWISGVPAAQQDEFAFVRAAVWADDIKSDPGHHEGNWRVSD